MAYGQQTNIEIFGKIKGECKSKIFIFFENSFNSGDSIFTSVKGKEFHFITKSTLPALCRIHFGENSQIQEFYIDKKKTFIEISSTLSSKETPDSLGGPNTRFTIPKVNGSETETMIRNFNEWKSRQKASLDDHSMVYNKLKRFVKAHPKSKASAYMIADGIHFRGSGYFIGEDFPFSYSEVEELSNYLDKSLKKTFEWENILRLLSKLESRRHRSLHSEILSTDLTDTNGNKKNIREFTGKYILIDFWASWCNPCRALNPQLKKLYAKYKDTNLEIIGISIDLNAKAWKKAIQQDNLNWPQLLEENGPHGEFSKYYDIESIPFKILVDKAGKIIGFNLTIQEIENVLVRDSN